MITIKRQAWNNCRWTLCSATAAARELLEHGFEVEVVDGDSGGYCSCDEVHELEALQDLELTWCPDT